MAHQVSVFMQNKPARLEAMARTLESASINIRAVTISTGTTGWGVVNLLVDNPKAGLEALSGGGHTAALREIVVVEVEDKPGGLRRVLSVLAGAGVNVMNAYGSALEEGKRAILVIDVENVDAAQETLAKADVKCLCDEEIYGI